MGSRQGRGCQGVYYLVKILRNFKERSSLNVGFQSEGLFGGILLAVKGAGGVGFFDFNTGALVRRIEVEPRNIYWSESGELVAIATEDTVYILRFSREAFEQAVSEGNVEDDGVEEAFEVITDIQEVITSAGKLASPVYSKMNSN